MSNFIYRGAASAIITPFKEDKSVDFDALGRIIEAQIEGGMNAIVICGTTGETATMTLEEQISVVDYGVKRVNKRIPVIVGVGSNCTETTLKTANEMEKLGVDALLIVNPYYNKSTQAGLVAHYTYIADNVNTPIILYNVPGRTGMSFTADTYAKLAKHKNIVGTKEASGNMTLALQTRYSCGEEFALYSGNDDQISCLLSYGGDGVVSVLGNIAPAAVATICRLFHEGKALEAAKIQVQYSGLIDAIFAETNPIPVKYGMELLGFGKAVYRLPLVPPSDEVKARVKAEMEKVGLI